MIYISSRRDITKVIIKMKICLLTLLVPLCLGTDPSCCMPRQAVYNTFTISSKAGRDGGFISSEKVGKVFLDFDRKVRLNVVTKTEGGQTQHITTFTDYSTGKSYVVVDGHCSVEDALLVNGTMPANCFPGPNAGNSYIRREMFGDTLTDVWRTDLTGSHGFMAVMHVSVQDCFPLTETDYGTIQGVKTQSTTFLSDAKPTIDDPSVFRIPSECRR